VTWDEAQDAMLEGKKVRRPRWYATDYISIDKEVGPGFRWNNGLPYHPAYSSRNATDWEVTE
jgi:hypothetical protein